MEVGPRALGNRSILAHPTDGSIRERLNSKGIKDREQFRPLAPSVLEEDIGDWFEGAVPSPYMLQVFRLKEEHVGTVDAVVHYDLTSRIQSVTEEQNPRYWRLLRAFREKTGIPMVLNTSFNSQEPIVCSPRDAIKTFLGTGLDRLVIGNFIATHPESP
jgi:carbamoyltransferase